MKRGRSTGKPTKAEAERIEAAKSDHATLERIARQIAADAGRDYDAPRAKRAHWRKRAARVLAMRDNQPPALITALMRAIGWQL